MARRKKRPKRRAVGHSDFAGPKGDPKVLQELAAEAVEANKKAEASDELVVHHIKLIKIAKANLDNSMSTTRAKRKIYNNRIRTAQADGLDKVAIKRALVIEGTPMHEVVHEEREVGRYLRLMDLSIGQQWSLFDPPKTVDAKAAGLHAGMNGEPADNNPHQPGSEEHVEWRAGWGDGQKTITDRMGPSH